MKPGIQPGSIDFRGSALGDGCGRLGFAALDQFLAVDAVRRPGKSLDAFGADGLVAADAIAEASIRNARQCLSHQAKLRAAHGALREQQFFLISRDRLVGDVTCVICVA